MKTREFYWNIKTFFKGELKWLFKRHKVCFTEKKNNRHLAVFDTKLREILRNRVSSKISFPVSILIN